MGEGERTEERYATERAEFEKRRRERQERRRRRLVMTSIVALLAVALAGLTAWFTYQKGLRGLGLSRGSHLTSVGGDGADDAEPVPERTRLHVLVIGTDEGPDGGGRTDTMMLVSYDPATADVGVLSIPRDTRVEIPGRTGFHRVNAAHAFGGPALAVRTVSHLLDIDIDHYVVVNFNAFEQFIDALGGVTMLVERPMRYDDFAQGLHIDIRPGLQVLNGEQALHYVRFRGDRLGDIALVDPTREVYDGRVKRQLDFVQAVAKEALHWSTLPKLPQLLPRLFQTVRTDISYDRAFALLVSLREFDSTNLEVAVLPGTSGLVGGASYWLHDPVRTRIVVDRVIRGEQVVKLEVLNGNGGRGVAARAAEMLRENGFDVVRIGNAPDGFTYEQTHIIVGERYDEADDEARAWNGAAPSATVEQLRRLLGGRVVVGDQGAADATVIIGQDFNG